MSLDLYKIRTTLEGLLAITDSITGEVTLDQLRLQRVKAVLEAGLPRVLPGPSRAEIVRLVELIVLYVFQGSEETLSSIEQLALQLAYANDEYREIKP